MFYHHNHIEEEYEKVTCLKGLIIYAICVELVSNCHVNFILPRRRDKTCLSTKCI